MKYADAKKTLRSVSKFDDTEIFYDTKRRLFFRFVCKELVDKVKNTTDTNEVNLYHWIESTRLPAERTGRKPL